MANLVHAHELAGWLGVTFDAPASTKAEVVLAAASALVRKEAQQPWEEGGAPDEVRFVVFEVAKRILEDPGAVVEESVGSYRIRYSEAQASALFLTAIERAVLGGFRTTTRGLWSLSTTRGDAAADTGWVPIEGTTAMFPWYASDVAP